MSHSAVPSLTVCVCVCVSVCGCGYCACVCLCVVAFVCVCSLCRGLLVSSHCGLSVFLPCQGHSPTLTSVICLCACVCVCLSLCTRYLTSSRQTLELERPPCRRPTSRSPSL